jgi:predicted Zn-dependent protease
MKVGMLGPLALCIFSLAAAQAPSPASSTAERVTQEYRAGDFAAAERDSLDLVQKDPSNLLAQIYLGQSRFMQKKYAEAIGPFEQARALDGGTKLNFVQRHIVTDQLVMAYGISGKLKQVHALLDEAIQQDPDYPLNYYNLACAFAGENDKARVLANLKLAFDHKDRVLPGEQMPDPRSDDSFQRYVHDPDFVKLMRQLGYR